MLADEKSVFGAGINNAALADSLRHAISNEGLSLHYQPMVRTGDGKVAGLEALVRWDEPIRGAISPAVMLPLAEEHGLSVALGRWVIRKSTAQFKAWKLGGIIRDSQLHINLSDAEISDPALTRVVMDAVKENQLKPEEICFELTEPAVRTSGDLGMQTMLALDKFGVRFALDNFGPGSTIDVLTMAPFKSLKIKRSLICGDDRPPNFRRLIRGILGLTRALDIGMIAEGVEEQSEVSTIAALGFGKVQGYALGRPAVPGQTEQSLISRRGWLREN